VVPVPKKGPKNTGQIIVHTGSGRDAAKILTSVINSRLGKEIRVYGGLFADFSCFSSKEKKHISQYNADILDEIMNAEITITTAGYNSAIETLLSGAKSILVPVSREQEIRARNFQNKNLAMTILPEDLTSTNLKWIISELKPGRKRGIGLNGSLFVAKFIEKWMQA